MNFTVPPLSTRFHHDDERRATKSTRGDRIGHSGVRHRLSSRATGAKSESLDPHAANLANVALVLR